MAFFCQKLKIKSWKCTVEKNSKTNKNICLLCYYITGFIVSRLKQGGKVIFFIQKAKNYYFHKFYKVWIPDPD